MAAAAQNSRAVGVRSTWAVGRDGGMAVRAKRDGPGGHDYQLQILNFQFAIVSWSILRAEIVNLQ
jgi:hypothetical protein